MATAPALVLADSCSAVKQDPCGGFNSIRPARREAKKAARRVQQLRFAQVAAELKECKVELAVALETISSVRGGASTGDLVDRLRSICASLLLHAADEKVLQRSSHYAASAAVAATSGMPQLRQAKLAVHRHAARARHDNVSAILSSTDGGDSTSLSSSPPASGPSKAGGRPHIFDIFDDDENVLRRLNGLESHVATFELLDQRSETLERQVSLVMPVHPGPPHPVASSLAERAPSVRSGDPSMDVCPDNLLMNHANLERSQQQPLQTCPPRRSDVHSARVNIDDGVRAFQVTPGDPVVVRAGVHSTQFFAELPPGAVVRGRVRGGCLHLDTGGVVKLKYFRSLDCPG